MGGGGSNNEHVYRTKKKLILIANFSLLINIWTKKKTEISNADFQG